MLLFSSYTKTPLSYFSFKAAGEFEFLLIFFSAAPPPQQNKSVTLFFASLSEETPHISPRSHLSSV